MRVIDSINRTIGLFIESLRQLGAGRIWLWLLGYFALSWLVLYAHYNFTSPLFYWAVSHWIDLFGSRNATGFTHYRGHFLSLPYFYDWAKIVLSIFFEGLILGAVAIFFYERFVLVDEDDRFTFRSLSRSWLFLAIGFVVINGALIGSNVILGKLLHNFIQYSPRRVLAFNWVLIPGVYAVILGLLLYVLPIVAVYRENVFAALGRSVRLFFRNPVTSVLIAAIVVFPPLVLSNVIANPTTIVDKFSPELVYWILVFGLVIDMIANFLWMGMSVRFLVDEEE